MSIVLKNKIKVDNNFINDLIAKSWLDSESIQNQIDSIEVDSSVAAKTVKLLKDLLTSYYVFTGCLETLENEPTEITKSAEFVKPEVSVSETPTIIPEEPVKIEVPATDMLIELEDNNDSEPFEYFVDFDEPTGEPLTDDDLYN
jgi:hypothetical protein